MRRAALGILSLALTVGIVGRVEGWRARGRSAEQAVGLASATQVAETEASASAAEQAGRLREAFDLYMAALQALADPPPAEGDLRLRARIVTIAAKVDPPPVPEDAVRFLTWATVAFKDAQGREGFERAAAECRKALRLAPWHAPVIFNMALIQERLQQYDLALANMRLYLQAPRAPNRDQAQAKVFELEYRVAQEREGARQAEAESDLAARGTLGITLQNATPELARQLQLPPDVRGVIVVDLAKGGLAEEAGLQRGDVIGSVNGKAVTEVPAWQREIAKLEKSGLARLRVRRGAGHVVVILRLTAKDPFHEFFGESPPRW